MKSNDERYHLRKLLNRYRGLRVLEILFLSASAALVLSACSVLLRLSSFISIVAGAAAGLLIFLTFALRERILALSEHDIVRFLNHSYPTLEASADLLLRKDDLPVVQQIQKKHVHARFTSIANDIRFPNKIGKTFLALAAGAVVLALTLALTQKRQSTSPIENQLKSANQGAATKITKLSLTVVPPAYTGLQASTASDLNVKIPQGSTIHWNIEFNQPVSSAWLSLSGSDSLKMSGSQNRYEAARSFTGSDFYSIKYRGVDNIVHQSDLFRIVTIVDVPPIIQVGEPASYTEVKFSEAIKIPVKAKLTDDYSLQDAWIVATVSKGDGESVRFREEKIRFTSPLTIKGKDVVAERLLDLRSLAMEPGDELYFYVEAIDYRTPASNHSRSETFFITIADTVTNETAFDTGAGVDLLPEYFRSQRQIIIDSEKLLEEKKNNKVQIPDFNSRSNDLGHDQKVLRLRYGQFMGEEAEGEGTHTDEHDDSGNNDDIASKFGHTHDSENEHNLVPESNDATSFEQSIRAKLRTALALMWEAELQLRINHPEKSLPYQYKILKLLKEISNDSRIYVRRTGFDPPPVKEDKRLKGDLSEIRPTSRKSDLITATENPAIARALPVVERLLELDTAHLSADNRRMLRLAGDELAAAAMKSPEKYFNALSSLRMILSDNASAPRNQELVFIRRAFWELTPAAELTPRKTENAFHPLDAEFMRLTNEPHKK